MVMLEVGGLAGQRELVGTSIDGYLDSRLICDAMARCHGRGLDLGREDYRGKFALVLEGYLDSHVIRREGCFRDNRVREVYILDCDLMLETHASGAFSALREEYGRDGNRALYTQFMLLHEGTNRESIEACLKEVGFTLKLPREYHDFRGFAAATEKALGSLLERRGGLTRMNRVVALQRAGVMVSELI